MFAPKKIKPEKSIPLSEWVGTKDRAVRHLKKTMLHANIDPEFSYAISMGTLFLMRGQNGAFTGKLECAYTRDLYDNVITHIAHRWALVDPVKAEALIKDFESQNPNLTQGQNHGL